MMGRARLSVVNPVGGDGKLYFDPPVVHEIVNKSPVTQVKHFSAEDQNFSPVRLKSSGFPRVVDMPQHVEYALGNFPSYNEVQEYILRAEIAGFGRGSIVCRRWDIRGRWKHPHTWGMITFTHTRPNSGAKWSPFTVKWFDDTDAQSQIEAAWMEDLVVIHACLDEGVLYDILETQDMPGMN